MPEGFFKQLVATDIDWRTMTLRLALALLCGLVVAGVHAISQQRRNGSSLSLLTTLVLLTILVAMTTIVIGDSVARAFGLVGALSIVRFRTVVDDTRDTAFVIFAVVAGMALGAGHLVVCLIGVPMVSLAAILLGLLSNSRTPPGLNRKLEVRIGAGQDPDSLLSGVFSTQLLSWKLSAVVSARQGAALDLVYSVRLRDQHAIFALVKAVHAIDGVQSVELKE